MEKEEEEEEDGRGYLVSRIIKAGDPLGFVYVVEGPGERGGVWRKEGEEEREKKKGRREGKRPWKRRQRGEQRN